MELPPFNKFVTEMMIFRNSCSKIFFKIGVLKNFAIFTGKYWSPWSPSFIEHLRWLLLDFRDSKYFFSAESGRTGFCSELLWKQELNLRKPLELLCKKWCSWKFCKFHRKTPVSNSLFNRVAGLGLQPY